MPDYHLKFADEAEADSILYAEQTNEAEADSILYAEQTSEAEAEQTNEAEAEQTNEAEADSILYTGQADDPPTKTPKYALIDVIGTIYAPTGESTIVDGVEVPQMAAIDGWHVNVRCPEEVEEFIPYIVTPKTPNRVWA